MYKHLQEKSENPKRVVVLGAGGFVGSRLMDRLKREGVEARGIRTSEVDLIGKESVEKLAGILRKDDAVVFASALTPDKGKDAGTMMKNLNMAMHVAAAVEKVSCGHVIYMSSDAMFAEDLPPITEATPAGASNLYGWMHVGRELIMDEATKKAKIPYLILRLCPVYGVGDTHNSYGPNRFVKTALQDKKIKLFGEGEERRPHVYVDDVEEILFRALQKKTTGLMHAVPAPSVSFRELAEMIAKLANNGTKIESSPRANPITHKHFDYSNLLKAFPEVKLTPIGKGLEIMLKKMSA